jgi:putative nucleotidyltransferase with HDIG domain
VDIRLEQTRIDPVGSALEGRSASGIWGLGDRLFNLVAVPISPPSEAESSAPVGAVILGANVSPMAERLRHVSKSDVVVVADDDRIFGSSMPPTHTRAAARLLPALHQAPHRPLEAEIGGVPYLVRLDQQRINYGGEECNHIILRSLEGTTRLTEKVRENLLLVAFLAVPLAFAIAWLGSRQIAQPLSRLAAGMLQIARTGTLHHGVAHLGGGHEVQIFQEAFRHMLDSIDESQRARERSYVEAVGAVVAAIDRRDHQSAGHSYRVAFFAVALAQEMGFQGDTLRAIEWGALLHDVGKIAVPDAILRKVGPLTDEEWHIMRQHPNWGYEMLADVQFLKPALEIIYNHHERWDGGGYPRGLKEGEIPMSARIFAVVDTYDAITSDRHYRRARSHKAATQELSRVASSQLDPAVVEAFVRIPEVELHRLRDLASQLDAGLKMPMELADLLTGHQMG